jgi:hypothetical protein
VYQLVEIGHLADFVEEIDHKVTDYGIVWVFTEEVDLFIILLLVLYLDYLDQRADALRQS